MAAGDVEVNVNSPSARAGVILDGVDDYVGMSKGMAVTGNQYTATVWVNIPLLAGGYVFANYRGTQMYIRAASAFAIRGIIAADGGQLYVQILVGDWPKDEWCHLALTYDGANIRFYVNGTEPTAATAQTGNIDYDLTRSFEISRGDAGLAGFQKGAVSELREYNRCLSSTEIIAAMNGDVTREGLVTEIPFKDNYDATVGGATGTNHGARLGNKEANVAAAVKADRTGASDHYMIAQAANKQIITTIVEE